MEGYYLIGGLVVGFILGALVYRNNAKKFQRILDEVGRLRIEILRAKK